MKKILYSLLLISFTQSLTQAQSTDVIPKQGPTPEVRIENPKTLKLSNGLTLLFVEDHKLPKVNAVLMLDNPPQNEGKLAGIGGLTANLLGNGTLKTPKDQYNGRLDFLGAEIKFEDNGAAVNALKQSFPEAFALMAEGLLQPLFTQQDFAIEKEMALDNIRSNEANAKEINKNVYNALLYGKKHPFGEFETTASINAITLADIKKNYPKQYNPNNAYLLISGDTTFEEAKNLTEKYFSSWKPVVLANNFTLAHQNLPKTEVEVVNVPSAVQSVITIGNLHSIKMTDKNYFPSLLANYILGGSSLSSRINQNLREKNAFTYGAYSKLNVSKYNNEFSVNTDVNNEVVPQAIKEILNEMGNINNISEEELLHAKAKIKGSFIMSLEDPSTAAMYSILQKTEQLPEDFFENYLKNVDQVSLAEVRQAINEFLKKDQLRIVVAGNANAFKNQLKGLGYKVNYYNRNAMPIVNKK